MSEGYLLTLLQNAATITLVLAGPVLVVSLVIGVVISLIQTATQINESTMTFIPKLVGVGLVLLVLGSWMLQQIVVFTVNLFSSLPGLK